MDDREKLAEAKHKVEMMTAFYVHFAVYVAVNLLLVAVNYATDDVWWAQWPILGWGIGIAAHAWAVFGHFPRLVEKWQVRKIKELKDRM